MSNGSHQPGHGRVPTDTGPDRVPTDVDRIEIVSAQLIGVTRTPLPATARESDQRFEYIGAVAFADPASAAAVVAELFPQGQPPGVAVRPTPSDPRVWNVIVVDADNFISSQLEASRSGRTGSSVMAALTRLVVQHEIADVTHDLVSADFLAGQLVELATREPDVVGRPGDLSSYEVARASWSVIPPRNEVVPTPPGLRGLFVSAWQTAKAWEQSDPTRLADVDNRMIDLLGHRVRDSGLGLQFDAGSGVLHAYAQTGGSFEVGSIPIQPAPALNANPGLGHPWVDPIDVLGPGAVQFAARLGVSGGKAAARGLAAAAADDILELSTAKVGAEIGERALANALPALIDAAERPAARVLAEGDVGVLQSMVDVLRSLGVADAEAQAGHQLSTFVKGRVAVLVLEEDAYILRLGSGERLGGFGSGLFRNLREVVAARDALVAEVTSGAGLPGTRRMAAIKLLWERTETTPTAWPNELKGWPASILTDVQIQRVPAGSTIVEGIVGPQTASEATVFASTSSADDAAALLRKGSEAAGLPGGRHQVSMLVGREGQSTGPKGAIMLGEVADPVLGNLKVGPVNIAEARGSNALPAISGEITPGTERGLHAEISAGTDGGTPAISPPLSVTLRDRPGGSDDGNARQVPAPDAPGEADSDGDGKPDMSVRQPAPGEPVVAPPRAPPVPVEVDPADSDGDGVADSSPAAEPEVPVEGDPADSDGDGVADSSPGPVPTAGPPAPRADDLEQADRVSLGVEADAWVPSPLADPVGGRAAGSGPTPPDGLGPTPVLPGGDEPATPGGSVPEPGPTPPVASGPPVTDETHAARDAILRVSGVLDGVLTHVDAWLELDAVRNPIRPPPALELLFNREPFAAKAGRLHQVTEDVGLVHEGFLFAHLKPYAVRTAVALEYDAATVESFVNKAAPKLDALLNSKGFKGVGVGLDVLSLVVDASRVAKDPSVENQADVVVDMIELVGFLAPEFAPVTASLGAGYSFGKALDWATEKVTGHAVSDVGLLVAQAEIWTRESIRELFAEDDEHLLFPRPYEPVVAPPRAPAAEPAVPVKVDPADSDGDGVADSSPAAEPAVPVEVDPADSDGDGVADSSPAAEPEVPVEGDPADSDGDGVADSSPGPVPTAGPPAPRTDDLERADVLDRVWLEVEADTWVPSPLADPVGGRAAGPTPPEGLGPTPVLPGGDEPATPGASVPATGGQDGARTAPSDLSDEAPIDALRPHRLSDAEPGTAQVTPSGAASDGSDATTLAARDDSSGDGVPQPEPDPAPNAGPVPPTATDPGTTPPFHLPAALDRGDSTTPADSVPMQDPATQGSYFPLPGEHHVEPGSAQDTHHDAGQHAHAAETSGSSDAAAQAAAAANEAQIAQAKAEAQAAEIAAREAAMARHIAHEQQGPPPGGEF